MSDFPSIFVARFNLPGCMPDDVSYFVEISEAWEFLAESFDRWIDSQHETGNVSDEKQSEFDHFHNELDSESETDTKHGPDGMVYVVDEVDLDESTLEWLIAEYGETWDHYGLPVIGIDGMELAIAEDDESADDAAERYIADTLWAFSAEWLSYYTPLEAIDIQAIQERRYEDCNESFRELIGNDWDRFVYDSISADGRGHFLSGYDGNEIEIGSYRIYRIN